MSPLPGRTSTVPERRSNGGGVGGGGGADDEEEECIDGVDNASAAPMPPPPHLAHPAAATSRTSSPSSNDSAAGARVEKPLRLALESGGAISEGPRLLASLSFRASSFFFLEGEAKESKMKALKEKFSLERFGCLFSQLHS